MNNKNVPNELLSKAQELASLLALTADELVQKQAKIDELQEIIEQLQVENQRLKAGEKNEIAKQPNKEDINKILNKIKLVDRNSAKNILLDPNISKEVCFGILNTLNIESNSRAKKETLVERILDTLFNFENQEYYYKIVTQLNNVKTRNEARNILNPLTLNDLKKIKAIMKISTIGKTKKDLIYSITQRVIGNKLDFEAIMNVKLK